MTDVAADPTEIPPQPTPTGFGVGIAEAPGAPTLVLLRITAPNGAFVFFLDKATATEVGTNLAKMAENVPEPSRIIAPPPGFKP